MEATTRGGHERENEPRSRSAQMRGWGWHKRVGARGGGVASSPPDKGLAAGAATALTQGKASSPAALGKASCAAGRQGVGACTERISLEVAHLFATGW